MTYTDHLQPRFEMPSDTSGILSLKEINGVSILSIEQLMKSHDVRYSSHGFLGQDESLIDILAEDNETVLDLGLTHEQIARDIGTLFQTIHYDLPPLDSKDDVRR